MASDEKPFRLRPRRPIRQRRDEARLWSSALKRLFHLVRMSSRRTSLSGGQTRSPRPYSQRCAVRVTYSTNKASGQWRAHGRYIERESATEDKRGTEAGFGSGHDPVNVASVLEDWQSAGDERMFKLIISPEFGERMDLEAHSRALMNQMQMDLGTTLEWVAVSHYNTSHPHVHIALRGVNDSGEALRLERDYIRFGIRRRAEDLCTAQLGYRTELDAQEAQRREIDQCRYTSLDRLINRSNQGAETGSELPAYFTITIDSTDARLHGFAKAQLHYVAARLRVLQKMGLAEPEGSGTWRVRRDFQDVLRAMQRAGDRQKTLAAHRALLSDVRLSLQVTAPSAVNQLEGRVLGHGQEETTGRTYVLIEGTDAKVHFIYQEDGIDVARHNGRMRVNSFVRLRKSFSDGRVKFTVDDLGDAEKLLADEHFMRNRAQLLIKRGVLPEETTWGGWLGRYHAALQSELRAFESTTERRADRHNPGRHGRQ